jgi:hypothetical protein
MRVIVQNAPGHPDNRGFVVSHLGMNNDRHWDDFKFIDREDQGLVKGWIEAAPRADPPESTGNRRRLSSAMDVTQEVLLDRFMANSYLDPNDDVMIDNALTVMREQGLDLIALGLDRDELRRRILQARSAAGPDAPRRLPVQPQAHRQVQRQRLREQTQSCAARICDALGQSVSGQRLALLGGTGAANNLGHVTVLLNRAVNGFLGIGANQRRELTTDELERAIAALDELGDSVQASINSQLN